MSTSNGRPISSADADRRRKRPKRTPVDPTGKTLAAKKLALHRAMKNAAKRQQVTRIMIDPQDVDGLPRTRTMRFGAVTISNPSPDAEMVIVNVKAGRDALVRAREAFTTPGVQLGHRRDIPTFRVDARDPKVLIREVDGRVDRGRIVGGVFVPAE